MVSLAIALTPLNGVPPIESNSLCFLPIFCLFLFFSEQPSQLVAGGGLPMLPARIWTAKRLPVPYLQYDTY